MSKLAVLITEETAPFVAKMHDCAELHPDVTGGSHYFVADSRHIDDMFNYIMLKSVFFKVYPNADKTALFQFLQ